MSYLIRDRVKFLSDATKILSSSLDYNTTLSNLADLAVNNVADFCTIDILDKQGKMVRVAARAFNPKKEKLANTMFAFPADPRSKRGIYQTARTGKPILVRKVNNSWLNNASRIPEEKEVGEKLKLRSFLFTPLKSRGRIIGVITLISSKKGFSYSKNDITLAQELADRAGVAVDNARLFSDLEQALKMRDLFISMASHELKTPVTTMYVYMQLLKKRANKGGKFDPQWVDTLLYEMTRLTKLINELLQISQIRAGTFSYDFEEIDVLEVIKKSLQSFRATHKNVKVVFKNKISDKQIKLVGDSNKLIQVIINLLDNSSKHNYQDKPIILSVLKNKKWLEVTVTDEGTGIANKDMEHLFDEFYKGQGHTKAGMGLGLFLVKRIIDRHKGKIKVVSKLKAGTTVIISLPLLNYVKKSNKP